MPYQEVGFGLDLVGDTHHLMAWRDGQLLAYLRLLDPVRHEGQVVIGRVVSSLGRARPGAWSPVDGTRAAGGGHLWLDTPSARPRPTCRPTTAAIGFVAVTEVYLEDDIPRIGMRRA